MPRKPCPNATKCSTCNGDREIEACCTCENEVGNCTCDGDTLPETEMQPCPECDGSGEVENED